MTIQYMKHFLLSCAFALFAAIFDIPYHDFYTILRTLVCITFLLLVCKQYDGEGESINLIYVFIAILFNPVKPIEFSKDYWMVIDAIISAYCLYLFYKEEKDEDVFIDNIKNMCLSYSGMKNSPNELTILSVLVKKEFSKYDIYTCPKFKMPLGAYGTYICKFISKEEKDNISEARSVTIGELHKTFSGDLFAIVNFIFGGRASQIDMSAFNQYILPQFLKAISYSLFENEEQQ